MKRLILCAFLTACGPKVDTPLKTSTRAPTATTVGRFEIERVGVFGDDLAYGNKRGIYLIKDKTTGAEYVGVSGIGICETGSHWVGVAGKGGHPVEDER